MRDLEHLEPELWSAALPESRLVACALATFKVRLCNNFWMLKAVIIFFSSFQLH